MSELYLEAKSWQVPLAGRFKRYFSSSSEWWKLPYPIKNIKVLIRNWTSWARLSNYTKPEVAFQYKRKSPVSSKSPAPDLDKSALPDWLREELNNSDEVWKEDLSNNSYHNNNNNNRNKADKEFTQRTKELYLEAQNAVRSREESYDQVSAHQPSM